MCSPKTLKRISAIMKILELVFVIIATGIYIGADIQFDRDNSEPNTLAKGILIMCLIITPVLLICYLVGQVQYLQQTFLEIMVNFVLFAGLLTIGSIGINHWKDYIEDVEHMHKREQALSMSSFCILGCMTYFADFVVATIIYNE